ncbi:hypothetical protein Syun_019399 [Stephania yunnanensis]|uniref:Uncharacterized protein n=1 Tax=Stephania yunnanensis TaxID=152371 RepID=A0AAP0IU15_9MAGN
MGATRYNHFVSWPIGKVLLEPNECLLMLPIDKVLLEDPVFCLYVEKYAALSFLTNIKGFIIISATIETKSPRLGWESMVIRPPSHPTYNINVVIKLALAEDARDQGVLKFHLMRFIVGDVTSMATVLGDMEVKAHFLAKEDRVVVG